MAECSELGFELPGFNGRKIEGNFEGGNVLIDPNSKDFPQPVESLRVPLREWGTSVSGKEDPKADKT